MMSKDEFHTLLYKHSPKLGHELTRAGGLRGIFDSVCSEYKLSTAREKLLLLHGLAAVGLMVEALEQPFVEIMQTHTYTEDEARREFATGVCRLLHAAVTIGHGAFR